MSVARQRSPQRLRHERDVGAQGRRAGVARGVYPRRLAAQSRAVCPRLVVGALYRRPSEAFALHEAVDLKVEAPRSAGPERREHVTTKVAALVTQRRMKAV